VWNHPLARLADVTLNPDPSSLPGGGTLQQLTNGLGGWALILALAGLVIGAAAWALGAHSQNYHQSFAGRRAVLVSGVAALLIGAAPSSSISSSTRGPACTDVRRSTRPGRRVNARGPPCAADHGLPGP